MLRNITKKIILARKLIVRDNLLGIAIGLMFSKKLDDSAMVFIFKKERLASLHMLFVFFPIDVLYLNKDNVVVEIKTGLKPCSIYLPKNKAKYIIELPEGTIEKTKTKVGDEIYYLKT